ncbi:MAG: symmetrical bis(5'-nucleosyl)-tetraphosphatase [Methylococcales bacterium]|nr:symmetrical bis(5'-nucleosyl)-tetraphosphatase [Methylococcales bacterium]
MTTYAIGSVKGNYRLLLKLLDTIRFDPECDRLWFTGNLVNEGPESLAVLRFVKSLGKAAVTVLGTQELHLLGRMTAFAERQENDNLDEILDAPDRDELMKWLRNRPLIHHDAKLNFTLVHAGIHAEWTFSKALTLAYEVESVLSGSNFAAFFESRGQEQTAWHAKLRGWKRLNFICNAYTLLAYYNERGRLDFRTRGPVAAHQDGLTPWYRHTERMTAALNIVFADEANFADAPAPGIYPVSAQSGLEALKLSAEPEIIRLD